MKKIKLKKTGLILLSFFALIWFLLRVIPKPSRASYPCQRAAFPLASGFVIWLVSTIGSIGIIRKSKQLLYRKTYITGIIVLTIGLGLFYISTDLYFPKFVLATTNNSNEPFVPEEGPNKPVGTGLGVNPGRVSWVYNPNATSWDGQSGRWWSDENTNQAVVDSMVDQSILLLTGENDLSLAYDQVFKYFNSTHEKGNIGYTTGEKIAIKVNMNTCRYNDCDHNQPITSPHVLLAYVRHLVEIVSVDAHDITIYDISNRISDEIYTKVSSRYPDVRFVDQFGQADKNNWESYKVDYECPINWSEDLVLERGGGNPTYLPKCVTQADYLINMADLKGHGLTGITMCAKNHFGTFFSYSQTRKRYGPVAAGVHPYIATRIIEDVSPGNDWYFNIREMGTYNPLVDIMGHEHLGRKTLLFILDALYCASVQQGENPKKWAMYPFNNNWTSSIFVSQDGVAIESVGLDFLRSEPTQTKVQGPVENYIHEAASAGQPPSGHFYDPENDGTRLSSLGVHEHWNNATNKQYSKNLGIGDGIELVHNNFSTSATGVKSIEKKWHGKQEIKIYPVPVKTYLTIELQTTETIEVKIFSVAGNVRFKEKVSGKSIINMEDYKKGVYVISLISKHGCFNKNIIKE